MGKWRRQSLKEGESDPAVFWAEVDYEKKERLDEKRLKPYSHGDITIQYVGNLQLMNKPVNLWLQKSKFVSCHFVI